MMKINLCLFILLLFKTAVFSQVGDIPLPKSWDMELPKDPMVIQLSPMDLNSVIAQDSINDMDKSLPWRFGVERSLEIDMHQHGLWTELPGGGKIWRSAIRSPQAVSLSINFTNLYLPPGSRLQLYSDAESEVSQTFTGTQKQETHVRGTWFVTGEIVWLEYFQPESTFGKPQLQIGSIVHGYRMGGMDQNATEANGVNGSGDCHYDVNCPIGEDFESQKEILKKSVAFVNLGNGYLCTAVLINNTNKDKTPYLLTANHSVAYSDPALWSIRFNWISPSPVCGTGEESGDLHNNFTISGAELIANNSLSDFALVKLHNNIPESWDVAFAGWDNSDTDPLFEVGIHHPQGDIMKICRDDSGARKIDANGTQVWLIGGGQHGAGNGWEIGTTESGSSGSPLFNEHGKIIGQLYAGEAGCIGNENNGNYDIYGRFGVSWDAGNSPQTRLMDWLDPRNSGQTTIETLQNILNVPTFQPIGELEVYPNPANTVLTVKNARYPNLTFEFYTIMGQHINSGSMANSINSISVENLAEGIYLLRLTDQDSNETISKKIVVKR